MTSEESSLGDIEKQKDKGNGNDSPLSSSTISNDKSVEDIINEHEAIAEIEPHGSGTFDIMSKVPTHASRETGVIGMYPQLRRESGVIN